MRSHSPISERATRKRKEEFANVQVTFRFVRSVTLMIAALDPFSMISTSPGLFGRLAPLVQVTQEEDVVRDPSPVRVEDSVSVPRSQVLLQEVGRGDARRVAPTVEACAVAESVVGDALPASDFPGVPFEVEGDDPLLARAPAVRFSGCEMGRPGRGVSVPRCRRS